MVKKILILLIMLFTLANANSVKATVSNTELVQGNMLQLQIKATGNRAAFPNIQEIDGVPVLGRHESQNNSFTYINGKMKNERATTLVLTLAPQKDLTIPSYAVNIDGTEYKTDPIVVKVVKSTAPQASTNNKFSLQIRANKKALMVGEPLLVTVYFSLQNGVRLSENPQYNKPEFKGFFVKEVGEEKNYQEGNRQVTELRYILIPKSEGHFTVGPATAKIGVADRNRRDMFGRFFGTTWVPIVSNSVPVEVTEKLEPSDLVGSFTVKNTIDSQSVKANKPVNLTVTIEGEGSLEDFELEKYEIDGVTVYSDDASVTTDLKNDTIQSTYSKHFAFISDHDFVIPAHSISVYDTQSKSLKKLEIPAYEIKVEGESKSLSAATTPATPPQSGKVQTNMKVPETSMLGEKKELKETNKFDWLMLVSVFVLGMILMYLLRYLPNMKWKRVNYNVNESEALKILYSHISEDQEVEAMVRKLYARKNGDKSVEIDKKVLKEMIDKVQDQK